MSTPNTSPAKQDPDFLVFAMKELGFEGDVAQRAVEATANQGIAQAVEWAMAQTASPQKNPTISTAPLAAASSSRFHSSGAGTAASAPTANQPGQPGQPGRLVEGPGGKYYELTRADGQLIELPDGRVIEMVEGQVIQGGGGSTGLLQLVSGKLTPVSEAAAQELLSKQQPQAAANSNALPNQGLSMLASSPSPGTGNVAPWHAHVQQQSGSGVATEGEEERTHSHHSSHLSLSSHSHTHTQQSQAAGQSHHSGPHTSYEHSSAKVPSPLRSPLQTAHSQLQSLRAEATPGSIDEALQQRLDKVREAEEALAERERQLRARDDRLMRAQKHLKRREEDVQSREELVSRKEEVLLGREAEVAQKEQQQQEQVSSAGEQRVGSPMQSLDPHTISYKDIELGALLGSGSFAEVFRGAWRMPCAVKRLKGSIARDSAAEFAREAEVMRQLRHPNIVKLLGVSVQQPHCYLVQELAAGENIFDILHKRRRRLSYSQVIRVAEQIADAMVYLHDRKVVHRDLKPQNVLLDPKDRVKLCDFGLARFKNDSTKYIATTSNTAGTPAYQAPEMLRDEQISEKVDVYSFGILLWEMYTGKLPWSDKTCAQMVHVVAIRHERPIIPQTCPAKFAELTAKCWAPQPDARPSFHRIKELIEACAEEMQSVPDKDVVPSEAGQPLPAKRSSGQQGNASGRHKVSQAPVKQQVPQMRQMGMPPPHHGAFYGGQPIMYW